MARSVSRNQSAQAAQFFKVSFGSLVTFVVMYCLYMLFVAPPDKAEMIVGIAVAGAASAAIGLFRAGEKIEFCPSLRDVLQGYRIPGMAVEGAYLLTKSLFLQLLGIKRAGSSLRAVPFSDGGTACRSSARAALAELYTTMTPNSVVLGIVHKQQLLLLHQIAPGKVSRMMRNLGGHS